MPFNPNLTLNALVVHLVAVDEGRVPLTQGALAHAAFLDLLRVADPGLAGQLHDQRTRKPFTLSPLQGLPGPTNGSGYWLRPGAHAALRLTLLDPLLFRAFLARLLQGGPDLRLRLGDVTFAVEGAVGTPGSDPWAGYATAGGLRSAAGAAPQVRMQFASPTAINWSAQGAADRRMILIPWPQAVFAALRGAWTAHTGDEIPPEFEKWVEGFVVVREVLRWQTGVFRLKNGAPAPGGFGEVVFEALDGPTEHVQTLNLLADFAFYSGVGSKTTMGMGQVRRVQLHRTE